VLNRAKDRNSSDGDWKMSPKGSDCPDDLTSHVWNQVATALLREYQMKAIAVAEGESHSRLAGAIISVNVLE
jgi:hypothetical protein